MPFQDSPLSAAEVKEQVEAWCRYCFILAERTTQSLEASALPSSIGKLRGKPKALIS